MSSPSPLDFTVVHARCVVPPGLAQHTALVLTSSMFPWPDEASPLDSVLDWFGTNLSVSPEPDNIPKATHLRAAQKLRRHVHFLSDCTYPLVLDLVHVTHTAAVRRNNWNPEPQVCGYATLSLPGASWPTYVAPRHIHLDVGQLSVAYQPLYSSSPEDTLTAIARALQPDGPPTAFASTALFPLADLFCGRTSVSARETDLSTAIARVADVAPYADDTHPVWSFTPERKDAGTDFTYDSLVASLSTSAYHRVFDARTNHDN